jgi:hypothetical protein
MQKLPDLTKVSAYAKAASGYSIAGKVMLGASALCAFFGVSSYLQAYGAQQEV